MLRSGTLGVLVAVWCGSHAAAQTVNWKTNYFAVTGETQSEIRQSIVKNRPFQGNFDAFTTWNINWTFRFEDSGDRCRCTSVGTTTTINTMLPFWRMPTNATPQLKRWWAQFYTRLANHELGHAQIGLAAAAHLRKAVTEQTPAADCNSLQQRLRATAEGVVADYRRREKEYDERTGHGSRE